MGTEWGDCHVLGGGLGGGAGSDGPGAEERVPAGCEEVAFVVAHFGVCGFWGMLGVRAGCAGELGMRRGGCGALGSGLSLFFGGMRVNEGVGCNQQAALGGGVNG